MLSSRHPRIMAFQDVDATVAAEKANAWLDSVEDDSFIRVEKVWSDTREKIYYVSMIYWLGE